MEAYRRAHQNGDGGWGLHVEGASHVFTTVLSYVALRLLDAAPTDPGLVRARTFLAEHGGPLTSASWGKFVLAVLGLYEWDGLLPVPPELWLLPEWLPMHPRRLWCHSRMVYLPMAYLYGRRATVPLDARLGAIRGEIYENTPWGEIDRRALARVLTIIRAEDAATDFICLGPVNKLFNTLVWHFENPAGSELVRHHERLPDYLWRARDGVKMQGYNSSQLWDTIFAAQAVIATGRLDEQRKVLAAAHRFIESNQVLADVPDRERAYRGRRAWARFPSRRSATRRVMRGVVGDLLHVRRLVWHVGAPGCGTRLRSPRARARRNVLARQATSRRRLGRDAGELPRANVRSRRSGAGGDDVVGVAGAYRRGARRERAGASRGCVSNGTAGRRWKLPR